MLSEELPTLAVRHHTIPDHIMPKHTANDDPVQNFEAADKLLTSTGCVTEKSVTD